MADRKYPAEIVERLRERLEAGESIASICRDPDMPNRRTIYRWMRGADELAEQLTDSMEIGFHEFAEETLRLVAECPDAMQARNILASRQWFLGKRSRAFAERPVVGVAVNVDGGDAFAAIAGALENAAAAKSGGRVSTRTLAIEGEARSIDPAGGLADLAGHGGAGLREDEDRG